MYFESLGAKGIGNTKILRGSIGDFLKIMGNIIYVCPEHKLIVRIIAQHRYWDHHIVFTIVTPSVVDIITGDTTSFILGFLARNYRIVVQAIINQCFFTYTADSGSVGKSILAQASDKPYKRTLAYMARYQKGI